MSAFRPRSPLRAALLVLACVAVTTPAAFASDTLYKVYEGRDGRVFLAHGSNNKLRTRDLDFRLAHEADALSMIRDRLLEDGGLRRYPVVIDLPDPHASGADKTTVAIERNVVAGGGDGGDRREVGRAYVIRPAKKVPATHENLLALLLALRGLDWEEPEREIADVAGLRRETAADAARFAGVAFRRDLARSPDGRYTVSVEWKGGRLRYLFRGKDGTSRALTAPEGYLAVPPVWSPQGDAFGYGSLRELVLVRLDGGGANVVRLRGPNVPEFGSLDLAFSSDGDRVVFTGTDPTGLPLPVYAADYWDGRPAKVGPVPKAAPTWAEYARADAAAGPRGASISPAKRAAAQKQVDRLAALLTEKAPAKPRAAAGARTPAGPTRTAAGPPEAAAPGSGGGIPGRRIGAAALAALALASVAVVTLRRRRNRL